MPEALLLDADLVLVPPGEPPAEDRLGVVAHVGLDRSKVANDVAGNRKGEGGEYFILGFEVARKQKPFFRN